MTTVDEDLPALFAAPQPTLDTRRHHLRPFTVDDAPRVQTILGDAEVARRTLMIPHPYPEGAALQWMATHAEAWRTGKNATWAVVRHFDGLLVGTISLRLALAHRRAEAGYWVAREAWGEGIATEALGAILRWGFETLSLHRVEAHHFSENPASGRVMVKAGMRHEGRVRGAVWRDDVPRDLELYGILRTDPRPG
jgi:RimJ/RimL family protein N-acetyltransferase